MVIYYYSVESGPKEVDSIANMLKAALIVLTQLISTAHYLCSRWVGGPDGPSSSSSVPIQLTSAHIIGNFDWAYLGIARATKK